MPDPNHTPLSLRAVIFDYGMVLSHGPAPETIQRMANLLRLTPEKFHALYDDSRMAYDHGDFTHTAYWSQLAEKAGVALKAPEIELLSQWDIEMWSRLNPPMIEWMMNLQSLALKTAILSNMPPDMAAHMRKQLDLAWLANATCLVFSSEIHLVKPDSAIYQYCLQCLEVSPSEALFIDDRQINVDGAKKVGIHALRFDSTAQLRSDLKALGFSLLPESAQLNESMTR